MSVGEYLPTTFDEGDCEYVDGEIVERNVGKYSHSWIQKRPLKVLAPFEERLDLGAFQDLRFRATASRYRIPDIGVWRRSDLGEEVPSVPPLLAIEILSPDDRRRLRRGSFRRESRGPRTTGTKVLDWSA